MEAKILITAQIRNIDIHLLQVSSKGFKVVWATTGTNVDGLLYKNYVVRCKAGFVSPSKYYFIGEGETTSRVPYVETTSMYAANRRFKLMCRAAQDPRIKFESFKP